MPVMSVCLSTGSYIQRLTPFFKLSSEEPDVGWSAQKVSNVHYMLQVQSQKHPYHKRQNFVNIFTT